MTHASQPDSMGEPSLQLVRVSGESGVRLTSSGTELTVIPGLGMLGTSIRRLGCEFLALPGGVAAYRAGHATGMPLLAPWANRLSAWDYRAEGVDVDLQGLPLHTDGKGLPIHGTMLPCPGCWELARLEVGSRDATLVARFASDHRPDQLRAFPFPHELTLEISVDAAGVVSVSTRLRPTGDRGVPVSFGFHPYFRLPTGHRSRWTLRLPARRHIELDGRAIPTGASAVEREESGPVGGRTFDDLYELGADRWAGLEHQGDRISLSLDEGYSHLQVYAPPGRRFVCLEPMTATVNALRNERCRVVPPGEQFQARFSLSIDSPGT